MVHVFKDGIPHREVPDAWLPAAAALNDYVSRVAGMPYLATKIGPGMAAEAGTAQYVPSIAEVHISSDVLAPGMAPDECKPADELFRSRFPLLIGGLLHETFHARYSRWVPRDLTRNEAEGRFKGRKNDVLVALEESRIEKRGVRRYTTAQQYLPAIVFDLLSREFTGGDDPYSASILLSLILGRAEAGIIGKRDAKPFRDLIEVHLSAEQIEAFLGLVNEYHALPFRKGEDLPLDEMESIANRWLEVLGDDPAEEGEKAPSVLLIHSEGDGEGEGGSGDSEGAEGSEDGDMAKAAREAAAEAKHDKAMDAADKAKRIMDRREAEARHADAERREEADKVAERVFNQKGIGKDGHIAGSRSRLKPRDPSAAERAAATLFAAALSKVRHFEPARTKVKTRMPGKRLNGRGAVARRVEEAQGRVPTAPQWINTKRAMTDEPPLKIGVAVDVSGSMNALAEPLALTAFIVGNGVEKAGGEYAQVVFGNTATGVVKAGRKVTKVPFVRPMDGMEAIKPAVLALDSELDLIDGEGIRILIVASDGCFVSDDQQRWADVMFPKMVEKGVILLHPDFEGGDLGAGYYNAYNPRHNNPIPPVVMPTHATPQEQARFLGNEIIKIVERYAPKAAA